jgi:phospholipid N-methyltransferase
MFVRRRLRQVTRPGMRFLELGAGSGSLTGLMLQRGLSGEAYDLNEAACRINARLNRRFVREGKLEIRNENFLETTRPGRVDLIVSALVLEHLDTEHVKTFFELCRDRLDANGRLILIVPANMKFWGIEDEIAGHLRRYDRASLERLAANMNFRVEHVRGLTYPVSNLLLPLSNYLVKRGEGAQLALTKKERTVNSGRRSARFKTAYPPVLRLMLNEATLYPFHLLQLACGGLESCLLLYCEWRPKWRITRTVGSEAPSLDCCADRQTPAGFNCKARKDR